MNKNQNMVNDQMRMNARIVCKSKMMNVRIMMMTASVSLDMSMNVNKHLNVSMRIGMEYADTMNMMVSRLGLMQITILDDDDGYYGNFWGC